MDKVRIGIIGMVNIGKFHADYLRSGKVDRCELTAVCSTSPGKLGEWNSKGVKVYGDAVALMESGVVDAVLLATPHFQHVPLGIAALERGLHLLCEKPIAAHKADAERLIAAHRNSPKTVFACMYQFRVEPRFLEMRRLIQEGAIGELVRVNWINTDWYRTEFYYASGGWRATWRGEGGGVLLNQCLHNLDTLQWLCGMPQRVRGFCQLGRYHQIEVEDNVTAYMEWASGATGAFVSSTGEAPGTNRLEIAGTMGRMVLEEDKLVLTQNDADMIQFSRTAGEGFLKPAARRRELACGKASDPHAQITRNFVSAILDKTPLIAPGSEGIHALELANAILFSSLQSATIELPLDAAAWESKLGELIDSSAFCQR